MTTYRVTWEIDVSSAELENNRFHDSAWGAAQYANQMLNEADNVKWEFSVSQPDYPALAPYYVDLDDTPEPMRGAASGYDRPSIT